MSPAQGSSFSSGLRGLGPPGLDGKRAPERAVGQIEKRRLRGAVWVLGFAFPQGKQDEKVVLEVELWTSSQIHEGPPETLPSSWSIPKTENSSSCRTYRGFQVSRPGWEVGLPSWGRQGDLAADTGPG